jgi:hydroxylamine reductase
MPEDLTMFCNQCEQTTTGAGCIAVGNCGKEADVAALQDLLTYALRGLAPFALEGVRLGIADLELGRFTARALFTTLTNVNFDADRLGESIRETVARRDSLVAQIAAAGGRTGFADPATTFEPGATLDDLAYQGEKVRIPIDWSRVKSVCGLQEISLYGIRGLAAYADHAAILGQEDPAVYEHIYDVLAKLTDTTLGTDEWVALALKTGEVNFTAMRLLDAGNTGRFGHPVPTQVSLGHLAGKAILVSGHDLKDLDDLLRLTGGTGVSVYTHGEMLPGHAYAGLNQYEHLRGHFGTAWQNQKVEFAAFPGAILMTTNCIQEPPSSYRDRIFTTGNVGWPGVTHVANGEFGPVVQRALSLPGFAEDTDEGSVWVGYGHDVVMREHPMGSVLDLLVDYIKAGTIRHFFLVGGCDGAKPGRSYYTEFVEKAPADTAVLTLACGKFRFFEKDLGAIGGVPRLLDVGQCNDAYSAITIAHALAEALGTDVNGLPLSLVLSWYEQKAVAIILTLLHLGFKNIRLGPSMPNFTTANVFQALGGDLAIRPITTVDEDLAAILGG